MFENAWNSFRKYVGFEKPELFANRYMAEMDARIQKGLKNRQSILDVYQIEMKKIEELQAGIVSPPKSVWKTSRYKERRIHALNKVITDYKSIFSRQIDDRFDEATLFNIKMQSGDHRRREQFLDNVRQSGLSQVLGEKKENREQFIRSLNRTENNIYLRGRYNDHLHSYLSEDMGKRSPQQLREKIEEDLYPSDKNQEQLNGENSFVNILEGDVYKDISDELSNFSALTLLQHIPVNCFSKVKGYGKNPVYDTSRKFLEPFELLNNCVKEPKDEDFDNLANLTGFHNAPNNPISIILKHPMGWKFMKTNHPKLLMEVMSAYMCENLDKTCSEALRTSGDIKQIDNEQYVKLFTIRQAISRITCEFSLHQVQEKLMSELNEFVEKETEKYFREKEQKAATDFLKTHQDNFKNRVAKINKTITENNEQYLKEDLFKRKLKAAQDIWKRCVIGSNTKRYNEIIQPILQLKEDYEEVVTESDSYFKMKTEDRFLSDNKYLLTLPQRIGEVWESLDLNRFVRVRDDHDAATLEKLDKLIQFCELGDQDNIEKQCLAERLKLRSKTEFDNYIKFVQKTHHDFEEQVYNKRLELMKAIFKVETCKYSDFNKMDDFLYMVFSGTTEATTDPVHQTGLSHMVKYYPKLLADLTFKILLRSILSSRNLSDRISTEKNMAKFEDCISSKKIDVMMRCIKLIKKEYLNSVINSATIAQPEYFQDYTFWKNVSILKAQDPRTANNTGANDLLDLSSNNRDKLEYLSEKYKDDPNLRNYIDCRTNAIKHIEQIEKDGTDQSILRKIKMRSDLMGNSIYLEGLQHTPVYPCAGNSWSVALSEMLFFKGVKLDQQDIRCYQPIPSAKENVTNYEEQHYRQNMGFPSEISDHMNLISKVLKKEALHKINIDKGDENLIKFLSDKIESTVKTHAAPLVYCCNNNYKIITGIKNKQISWYDPLIEKEILSNKVEFGKDFMIDLTNKKQVSLYWLTDIAPEYYLACGSSFSSEIPLEKTNKKAPTQKLCRITDNYEHENYNAFELKNSDKNKDNDFMHEYIYLPKREFKNA